MRGGGGVVGEERLVSVPKFHSLGKCTMTNIQSNWMFNSSYLLDCVNFCTCILECDIYFLTYAQSMCIA